MSYVTDETPTWPSQQAMEEMTPQEFEALLDTFRGPRCEGGCLRVNWRDERPDRGRVRTFCFKCGKFIGMRPEHLVWKANKDTKKRQQRMEM
jgi:hypothetical protein